MTTEHVSVPRALDQLIDAASALGHHETLRSSSDDTIAYWRSMVAERRSAILSRATPSDDLANRITVLEDDCDQLMKERDAAEASISDMFEKVTGRPAEWSNLWGYAEAVEEAEEHVAQLEDKIKSQSQSSMYGLGCASMVSEPGLYIKWSDAPDWANWFAADFFTQCWWYENKPVAGGNQWIPDGGRTMRAFSRAEWTETLQQRPALQSAQPSKPEYSYGPDGKGPVIYKNYDELFPIKPSAHLVVTDELVQLVADDLDGIFAIEDIQEPAFLTDVRRSVQRIADELATSLPAAKVPDAEVRLWDTQWMSIVNHDNCYRDWSKDDAIAHAVKMTEQAIARNVADGKLPPKKIAAAPQAGES